MKLYTLQELRTAFPVNHHHLQLQLKIKNPTMNSQDQTVHRSQVLNVHIRQQDGIIGKKCVYWINSFFVLATTALSTVFDWLFIFMCGSALDGPAWLGPALLGLVWPGSAWSIWSYVWWPSLCCGGAVALLNGFGPQLCVWFGAWLNGFGPQLWSGAWFVGSWSEFGGKSCSAVCSVSEGGWSSSGSK